MNIKNLFKKSIQQIGSLSVWKPEFWSLDLFSNSNPQKNTKEFIVDGYGCNPYVYMVVSRIASVIKNLPFNITNESDKEIKTGDLFDLFNEPNEAQYSCEFIENCILELLTAGEIFILNEVAIGFDKPVSLKVLNAQNITPYADRLGVIYKYDYQDFDVLRSFLPEEILSIKLTNIVHTDSIKGIRGFSPLESLFNVYKASNSIFEAEKSIFDNRGITGVLTNDSDTPMLPKEQESIQNSWQGKTAGAGQFGKILVSNSKLRYLQLGMSPEDLTLTQLDVKKLRIICSVFNLDSSLFNDPENKTYNNRSEAQKSAYTDCYLPTAEFLLQNLNGWLQEKLNTTDKIVIDKNKIDALKEVNKILSDMITNEVKAGILSAKQALVILYPELQFDDSAKPEQTNFNQNTNGQ